jgi:mono/diheme cytochrome c family protein
MSQRAQGIQRAQTTQRAQRAQRAQRRRGLRVSVISAAIAVVALGIGSSAWAQAAAATPQESAPAGNAETGKRVFTAYYCYACHGTVGQGGSAGARIAPRPIAFAAFLRYVRKPSGGMPPYTSKVISEQELTDIYAFLRSVPAPPAAQSIPLLNQ